MLLGQEDNLTRTDVDPRICRESWQQIPSCDRDALTEASSAQWLSFDKKRRIDCIQHKDYGKEVECRYDHAMVTYRKLTKSVTTGFYSVHMVVLKEGRPHT
jgi:hypothetical protein